MTVRELLEALAAQDPDALVVLAKDGEGNGYSPLDEASDGRYVAETTWSGYLPHDDGDEALVRRKRPGVDAVVLWPAN